MSSEDVIFTPCCHWQNELLSKQWIHSHQLREVTNTLHYISSSTKTNSSPTIECRRSVCGRSTSEGNHSSPIRNHAGLSNYPRHVPSGSVRVPRHRYLTINQLHTRYLKGLPRFISTAGKKFEEVQYWSADHSSVPLFQVFRYQWWSSVVLDDGCTWCVPKIRIGKLQSMKPDKKPPTWDLLKWSWCHIRNKFPRLSISADSFSPFMILQAR